MDKVILKYKNSNFKVTKDTLFINSKKLQNIKSTYEFEEDDLVSNESFLNFLGALTGNKYTVNCSNVYELKYLANKWGFNRLKNEAISFITQCNSPELALSKFFYKTKFNKNTSEIIRIISSNFDHYLKFKKIDDINFETFNKIITCSSFKCSDQFSLKNYIFNRYQKDPKFSTFFKYIDPSLFTDSEKKSLKSDPSIDIKINQSITFGEQIKEQQKQLQQLEQKLRELSVSKDSDEYITSRLEKLRKKFDENIKQKENQKETELPVEGFLLSLNTIKESLEGIDLRTQDLEYKFGQAIRFAERYK